jgi:2-desacetyl-2-hydroxyethyl bacteriochlorophyllide A dehydrogenase
MQAVVCNAPGELVLETRPDPERGADEVLVRVRRVGVCGTDMHIFAGRQPFVTYPRIMGHEFSGEVAEAPAGSALAKGDVVFVTPYIACGRCVACRKGKTNCCVAISVLGVHRDGALAEYLSVPQSCVFKAEGVGFDEAAMLEFLAIGRHAVRRGAVGPGQRVLVQGAGPIGLGAALFARLAGAEITVLDMRADRLAFCREHLGVAHALAPSDDIEPRLAELTGGEMYDVVFDATGAAAAMQAGFARVAHGGAYVLISVVLADITFSDPEFHKRETTLLASRNAAPEDFAAALEAMRAGLVPARAFNTHRAALADVPRALPEWINPAAGVIKALVEL